MAAFLRREPVQVKIIIHSGLQQEAAFLGSSGKCNSPFGNRQNGLQVLILQKFQDGLDIITDRAGTDMKTRRQLFIMKILAGRIKKYGKQLACLPVHALSPFPYCMPVHLKFMYSPASSHSLPRCLFYGSAFRPGQGVYKFQVSKHKIPI